MYLFLSKFRFFLFALLDAVNLRVVGSFSVLSESPVVFFLNCSRGDN